MHNGTTSQSRRIKQIDDSVLATFFPIHHKEIFFFESFDHFIEALWKIS